MNFREGNKLIAERMGVVVTTPYPFNKEVGQSYHYDFQTEVNKWYPGHRRFHVETEIKYHTSFDWLVPVVKIIFPNKGKELKDVNFFDVEEVWELVVQKIEEDKK